MVLTLANYNFYNITLSLIHYVSLIEPLLITSSCLYVYNGNGNITYVYPILY